MRFFDISATAIAATAMLTGAFAAVAPPSYEASSAPAPLAYTSATTTYYTTRTVMRVVETMTATRNGTASTYQTTETATSTATSAAVASVTLYSMGNGTSPTLATGALPSASGVYEGSASQLSIGMVALVGFAGLLL